ncbi:MAG TPA: glycosyltransferase family 4 protein [Gemmatimonadales bacterium]|nr:glycosyltransferase family 4 protein [Gemmatimonadales bacterium]
MTIPSLRLALIAEGDPETRDSWSGLSQKFVQALRRAGANVRTFNVELSGWRRALIAAVTIGPEREAWRGRYLFHPLARRLRSRLAGRAITGHQQEFDAIIQIGATFLAPRSQAPLVIYCDGNVRFAEQGAPHSSVAQLSRRVLDRLAAAEAKAYGQAARIWCTSDALARSFTRDFGVPAERIKTIWAGANVDTAPPPDEASRLTGIPRVLFVGKRGERKGVMVLLEAFARVRARLPQAELHLVGCRPPGSDAPGVTAHGFIASDRPEGKRLLQQLYSEATVFCLPSHYEPFGVVFLEAMLAELPCIGTDRWAMPEIIENGVTGWTSPDSDVPALAACLEEALVNRAESRRRGMAGRRRALERFTWDRVAARALEDLGALLPAPAPVPRVTPPAG